MIRSLQKRFVTAAMAAVTLLIVLMLGAINGMNVVIVRQEMDRTLEMISDNEGNPGNIPPGSRETPGAVLPVKPEADHDRLLVSNFFLVRFDEEGSIVFTDVTRIASIEQEEAEIMAGEAYAKGAAFGKSGSFRYILSQNRADSGTTGVFLDTSSEKLSYIRVLAISIGIGLICWGFMLVLVIFLSRKAIRPIAENMERQKQFVTNAGHEIKTPLAIIQANTDAMELYNGQNKWSRNITQQVERLNGLMQNLLLLSKADELTAREPVVFSFSDLLWDSTKAFRESMKLRELRLEEHIQEHVSLKGDREQLTQLISILLDNAVKYADHGGRVWVSLQQTDRKVILQVENTCGQLPGAQPDKLFDRFYRADGARTQKNGGYGIGLSLAKSITEANRGRISAKYEQPDRIIFVASFHKV